jgi:putative peptidoglycan lipid II flippase
VKNKLKKIKTLLLKPQGIALGTVSIMIFTIISKAFGFVREMVLAANFGTSWRLDALVVSMEPATSIGGIISGSIASMMIPVFLGEKRKNEPEKVKAYTTQILFLSSLLLIGFGILFSVFPEFFIKIFAPKFNKREFEYAVRMMRYIGFLPLVQGFTSLSSSFLKAERNFLLTSIIQLFFNLIAIPTIVFLAPLFGELSYLFAYILGYFVMDISLLYIIRNKINIKKTFGCFTNPVVKETIHLSIPLFFSGGLGMINGIVDKAFASSLDIGSISAIRYANTIRKMISTIIIGSLLTTVFTEISQISVNKDKNALESRIKKTSNDLLSFMIPITFWLILMAKSLISLLFERGAFSEESTNMVTMAFIGYSFILIMTPVSTLLVNIFTAFKKTYISLLISIISICLNYLFNWLLISRFGILGITLSTTFVMLINFLILNILQKKHFGIVFFQKKQTLKIFFSTTIVFIICFFLKENINSVIWLILTNTSFLILFISFNKKNLSSILRRFVRKKE